MKPSTLRTLTRLMLVNGLALLFGLITVSNTLATSQPDQAAQTALDRWTARAGQAEVARPASPEIEAASEVERAAPAARAVPEQRAAARAATNAAAITETGSTQLITGVLSQDWGDFDRDGYLDLALGTTSGISIYHNLAGQLVFSTSLTPTYPGYGVRWADLDGNGWLELVTVRNAPGANGIYRYAGGAFISYTAFSAAVPLARVAVLSGTRDLVASTSVISTPCTIFYYRRNSGNNLFNSAPECVSTAPSAGLGAGDFDNDGDADLAVGSFPNYLKLLINSGNVLTEVNSITQTNAVTVDTTTSWPYDFAWGDYDGDGLFDLAAAFPLQRQVRIYHNEGPGSSAKLALSNVLPTQRFMTPLAVDWGDFNGDGALDLAVADDPPRIVFNVNRTVTAKADAFDLAPLPSADNQWTIRAIAPENTDLSAAVGGDLDPARVYAVAGGHLQSEIVPLSLATAANSVAWGDMNGDGRIDLVVGAYSNNSPNTLFLNTSGAVITASPTQFGSGNRQSVVVGKLDRKVDKQLGLIVGGVNSFGQGVLTVYTRTTQSGRALPVPGPVNALALGDLNNDGWLDLLVGAGSTGIGTIWIYRNDPVDFAAIPIYSSTVSGQIRNAAWADYDPPANNGVPATSGNRFLDFAVATSQQTYIFQNNKNNTFTVNPLLNTSGSTAVAWGDFNNDGQLDLAVGTSRGLKIFRQSNGQFSEIPIGPTTDSITSLAAGDWNNDGRIDLAAGLGAGPVQVYANLGDSAGALNLVAVWASQDSGATTGLAWGDVNNDGYLDLAVSRSSGSSGVYYNASVTPRRLPNPPSTISIARPGKTFDAYLYSSSEFLPGYLSPTSTTLASTVTIYYTVTNPAVISVTNTLLELSLDGGATWQAQSFTGTVVPAQASATGRGGVLVWDARQYPSYSDNALFRIRVVDQAAVGPFQRAASVAVSPPFRVRTMSCQWLTGLWIDVFPGRKVDPYDRVTFSAKLSDYSGGTISYTWTIVDGPRTTYINNGSSQVHYQFTTEGRGQVTLQAANSRCTEGPPLEAYTEVQVGTITPTLPYQLYLPLVRRSTSTVLARPLETGAMSGPQASTATMVGGATACLTRTILPGTRPTVDWLAGLPGYHGQPALNADGSRFAFWSTSNVAGTNADGNIELYYAQVNQPGSCVTFTQITSSTGNILKGFNLGPALNAGGDRLAFFSDRDLINENPDQNFEIFAAQINPSGSISVAQVTHSARGVNAWPSLTAAGDQVAFVSDWNGGDNSDGNQEIFSATIPISGAAVLTQVTDTEVGTFNDEPVLSTSGARIAFVRGGAATSGLQEIFTGNPGQAGSLLPVTTSSAQTFNYRPSLGGDGTQYAIAYATTAFAGEVVNLAAVSGTAVSVQPVFTTTANSQPALNAADGSRLLVVSGTQQLAVLTLANQGTVPVYTCAAPDCLYSALSGDGMHVAFASADNLSVAYYETASLALTVTQPNLPGVAGFPLTRTLVLTNTGPGSADNVVVSSTLRDGLSAILPITMTSPSGSICSGIGSITCWIPGMAVNSSVRITLSTRHPISIEESGPLALAVEASAWQAATSTMNLDFSVGAESDLRIAKAFTTTALAGDLVTYTLTITNDGPSRARDITVTDQLPDDLIFKSYRAFGNVTFTLANTGNLISGTLDHMDPRISGTIQIVAQISSMIPAGQIISNTGVITSAVVDPQSTNNLSRADFIVTARSNLTVTKLAPAAVDTVIDSAAPGEVVTYTIVFTNHGPSLARNVVLSDVLPLSVTYLSQISAYPPATPMVLGKTITWSWSSIAPQTTGAVTFTGRVITTTAGPVTLTNRSIVSATTAPLSATATADTFVVPRARLAITKTLLTPLPIVGGTSAIYQITVANLGPSVVPSAVVTDVLPDTVILGSVVGTPNCTPHGSPLPEYLVCTTLPIQSGGTRLVIITGTLGGPIQVGDVFTNTAYAASSIATAVVSDSAVASATLQANLKITKTLSPAGAATVIGQPITYTIEVGNSGPSYAPTVTLTDTMPAEIDNIATVAPPPGCNTAGRVVTCPLFSLDPFSPKFVTITGRLTDTLLPGDVFTNTAVATSTVALSAATNSLVSTATWQANMRVTKLAPPEALAGTPLTYTIVVVNDGPSPAPAVMITDRLPLSLTFLSQVGATPPVLQALNTDRHLTWTLASDLAPGATQYITFSTRITSDVSSGMLITNTAYATSPVASALASGTASTPIQVQAKLALTKTALPANPIAGQNITYAITVTNLSDGQVNNVTITDKLPAEVSYRSETSPGVSCSQSGGIITCTKNPINAGDSVYVTIVGQITSTASATFTNTAYVSSTKATRLVSDTVSTTPGIQVGLQVTKMVSPGSIAAGESLVYTITVGNRGPSMAGTVFITDQLPVELNFTSASPGYTSANGVYTFTLANLDRGTQSAVTLTGQISNALPAGTTIANTAYVSSPVTATGASHQANKTITSRASLTVTKLADSQVLAGNPLTYTIWITNNGPSLTPFITLTDQLSSALTLGVVPGGCSGAGNVITCTFTNVDVGPAYSRSVVLTPTVNSNVPNGARIVNTAVVTGSNALRIVSGAFTTTIGTSADLSTSTTIAPASVISNTASAVRVTIVFTNAGPSDAQAVYITETLNALTYTTFITQPAYASINPTGVCIGGSPPHRCAWIISVLTATFTGTIEFTATTPITTAATQVTAQITSTGTFDPNPGDNTTGTTLYYAQTLARIYWVGLQYTRWPLALINTSPRNFWSLSP